MLRFLLLAVAAFIFLLIVVRIFEKKLVFYPTHYPSDFRLPESFELAPSDVWIHTEDGVKIHGWLIEAPDANASVLIAHGNAGNLADRAYWLELYHKQIDANLLIFDYRGYGRSAGSASEEGCYLDATAAYDWLQEKYPGSPIIAHGRSLGGAVAIELAVRRELAGMIVESSFTSANDMAKLLFGPIPVTWFSKMKWASVDKVPNVKTKKLFMHGDRDQVVPYELGERLYRAAAEPKQFLPLPGADHHDTFVRNSAVYFSTIRSFIESCVN